MHPKHKLLLDLFEFNVIYYVFNQKICIKICPFCIYEFHNESIALSGLKKIYHLWSKIIMKKINIGITDSKKFDDYSNWILSVYPDINIIRLSYQFDNAALVSTCDGIIMTGGEDVHPSNYGKPENLKVLDINQINEARDEFELELLKTLFQLKKPILGICRGLQITNVFLGGTLISDIPSVLLDTKHGKIAGKDQIHEVEIVQGSAMNRISGKPRGEINSAHHQSADQIGKGLMITAFTKTITNERIVEALEWEDPNDKSWLLLLQWHPERIASDTNFSIAIRTAFINEVKKDLS